MKFGELVNEITKRGIDWHRDTILRNTNDNASRIEKSIREVEPDDRPTLIVSAGPSLYKKETLKRIESAKFQGILIATDGAYVQCLRHGIVPDFVITLDPHPTRMVRWFGDPEFEKNSEGDDYFSRQDLDLTFRANAFKANEANIELVNQYAYRSRFIVSTTSPRNVIDRLEAAGVVPYWFVSLVDKPDGKLGLTREMVEMTGLPAMNTGGTVGTASWVFAHTKLKARNIAVSGMTMGYYMETPFQETQSFNMLKEEFGEKSLPELMPHFTNPDGEEFYTDPTYWFYRLNFLDLLSASKAHVFNVSEGGLLFGDNIVWITLDEWLKTTTRPQVQNPLIS